MHFFYFALCGASALIIYLALAFSILLGFKG